MNLRRPRGQDDALERPGGLREQPLRIRYTVHGPVISDHPGLGTGGDKILALRSTDAETRANTANTVSRLFLRDKT